MPYPTLTIFSPTAKLPDRFLASRVFVSVFHLVTNAVVSEDSPVIISPYLNVPLPIVEAAPMVTEGVAV